MLFLDEAMKKPSLNIRLGVGEVSLKKELGLYYQDFTPAEVHFKEKYFGDLDKQGLPMSGFGSSADYSAVLLIQYGLICHDKFLKFNDYQSLEVLDTCIEKLIEMRQESNDSWIFRNPINIQYNLEKGWISGMYQGQALSLFLRYYQITKDPQYQKASIKIFDSFFVDHGKYNFMKRDNKGCLWIEEYPTKEGSYVLNGFGYAILGILDFYRIMDDQRSYQLYNECLSTLRENLSKYNLWYWSLYDQQKKQLISAYYMINVHIPLMNIFHQLTRDDLYAHYAKKWEKDFNSAYKRIIVWVMYRLRPRILRFIKSRNE